MDAKEKRPGFGTFLWRAVAVQVTTYFLCGILFSQLFNYKELFGSEGLALFMKPTTDPLIALGPALQVLRGALFALVLYPFRNTILAAKNGWLHLWLLFLALAIFGVCGPSPGSVEGFIYTIIPLKTQLLGLPEIMLQTLLFSAGLVCWYKKPNRIITALMIAALALIFFMSTAGYLYLQSQAVY